MTLSQIIARQSFYDKEIPDKGDWKIRIVVIGGKIEHQSITEELKESK